MRAAEIIGLLSDERSSLSDVLLKTKIFLHEIGKKDLVTWVDFELSGYPEAVPLPDYRILELRVMGNLMSSGWKADAQPLPIQHLENSYREKIEKAEMREPIRLVEELASKKQGSVRRIFPPEAYNQLGSNVGPGWEVVSAWCDISVLLIKDILVQVRSKLLDFLLELQDTVTQRGETDITKANTSMIDVSAMFNRAIFGDNAVIIVGDKNLVNIASNVIINDFNSLKRALKSIGVPEEELSKLGDAVEEDTAKLGKASFEGKTGSWYMSLLGKAASGAVNIAASILTTDVAQALAKFMGLG